MGSRVCAAMLGPRGGPRKRVHSRQVPHSVPAAAASRPPAEDAAQAGSASAASAPLRRQAPAAVGGVLVGSAVLRGAAQPPQLGQEAGGRAGGVPSSLVALRRRFGVGCIVPAWFARGALVEASRQPDQAWGVPGWVSRCASREEWEQVLLAEAQRRERVRQQQQELEELEEQQQQRELEEQQQQELGEQQQQELEEQQQQAQGAGGGVGGKKKAKRASKLRAVSMTKAKLKKTLTWPSVHALMPLHVPGLPAQPGPAPACPAAGGEPPRPVFKLTWDARVPAYLLLPDLAITAPSLPAPSSTHPFPPWPQPPRPSGLAGHVTVARGLGSPDTAARAVDLAVLAMQACSAELAEQLAAWGGALSTRLCAAGQQAAGAKAAAQHGWQGGARAGEGAAAEEGACVGGVGSVWATAAATSARSQLGCCDLVPLAQLPAGPVQPSSWRVEAQQRLVAFLEAQQVEEGEGQVEGGVGGGRGAGHGVPRLPPLNFDLEEYEAAQRRPRRGAHACGVWPPAMRVAVVVCGVWLPTTHGC